MLTVAIQVSRLKVDTVATMPLQLRDYVYNNRTHPHGLEQVPGVSVFGGGEPIVTVDGVRIVGMGVCLGTLLKMMVCVCMLALRP